MSRNLLGALCLALALALGPMAAHAQTVKYLNQLSGAAALSGTDTLPLCQNGGAGCGSGNALVDATIAQLNTYFQSQLSATLPLTVSGGVIAFANQSANTILAGPASGAATAPAFRALVPADEPGVAPNYRSAANASYTFASTDLDGAVCLAASGPTANATFTIPQATSSAGPFGPGATYIACNLNASYTVTLAAAGGSGSLLGPSAALGQYGWAILISDGTNWLVLER